MKGLQVMYKYFRCFLNYPPTSGSPTLSLTHPPQSLAARRRRRRLSLARVVGASPSPCRLRLSLSRRRRHRSVAPVAIAPSKTSFLSEARRLDLQRQQLRALMWSSMASHKRGGHKLDRTRSCADRALRGLRFISSNKVSYAWREVQANFDRLAHDGYLSRSDFAECIGMTESKEFALELFDTLNRRRQMKLDTISKEELREIWQKITDNSFDSRLLIFLDICSTGEAEEQDQGDPGRWPRGVKRSREVEEQIQHRRSWALAILGGEAILGAGRIPAREKQAATAGEASSHGWRSAGQDWRRDGRGSGARWAARCWPAIWGEPQFQFLGKTTLL